MSDTEDILSKLNSQTSKIAWSELQKFYAQGLVVEVDSTLDLIKVAAAFSQDNKAQVEQWLADNSIYKVEDQRAQYWLENETLLWAVVVAPWVLVQEISNK